MTNNQSNIKLHGNLSIPPDEFYYLIMSSLQDYSIFTTDKNLIINCWCAGSTKIFGYGAEEVLGKHGSIVFTDEDIANGIAEKEMEVAVSKGRAADNRWHITKDGSLFFAYGQLVPIKNEHGEHIGFVKILRDLTERKMAEDAIKRYIKELEELNNHKENILAILSHDLRSPLGTIIQIADHMRSSMDELDSVDAKNLLENLHMAATDELNMLDYLLEWARIKYAAEAFSPGKIDLRHTIAKVFDLYNDMAAGNDVYLVNEVIENCYVYADKKMLISIIRNLVSNALKFTPPGGSVTISARKADRKVVMKVQDTGIGMSPEHLNKLFIPKLKTLSKTRKDNKSAGIGLLLVKGFLEKIGGEINVESTLGEGTTFFVTLPTSEYQMQPADMSGLEFGGG